MRYYLFFAMLIIGLMAVPLPSHGQETQATDQCQLAKSQLRYYFMEYNPQGYLNLKYLEDLYFACDSPGLSSTLSYYYLKSASLLQVDENYVAKPSDLFYYFYQKFKGAVQRSGDLMLSDPDFAATLARRADELARTVERAERLGGQPYLNSQPAAGSANQRVAPQNRGEVPTPSNQRLTLEDMPPPSSEKPFPHFGYPPARVTDVTELPSPAFAGRRSLGDVNEQLVSALNQEGYYGKHYYCVPEGFALLTQMERFFPDGRSMEPLERWRRAVTPDQNFSLRPYFMSLVFARPGYYRFFAFVVVPRSIADNPRLGIGRLNDDIWTRSEGEKLPMALAKLPFSAKYTVQAYVFEFVVPGNGKEAYLLEKQGEKTEGYSAAEHLERARLWAHFKP